MASRYNLTVTVSPKGAVMIRGFGRFPLTIYPEHLATILDNAEALTAFVERNRESLSWKAIESTRVDDGREVMRLG